MPLRLSVWREKQGIFQTKTTAHHKNQWMTDVIAVSSRPAHLSKDEIIIVQQLRQDHTNNPPSSTLRFPGLFVNPAMVLAAQCVVRDLVEPFSKFQSLSDRFRFCSPFCEFVLRGEDRKAAGSVANSVVSQLKNHPKYYSLRANNFGICLQTTTGHRYIVVFIFGYSTPPSLAFPFSPAALLLRRPCGPSGEAVLAGLQEIRMSLNYPKFGTDLDGFANLFATQILSGDVDWTRLSRLLNGSASDADRRDRFLADFANKIKRERCEWVAVRVPAPFRDYVLTVCFTVRDFRVLAFSVEKFISCSVFESGDDVWVVLMTSASAVPPRFPELTDDGDQWEDDD
jgi:hypothetical protein